jgi:hypothetical protein
VAFAVFGEAGQEAGTVPVTTTVLVPEGVTTWMATLWLVGLVPVWVTIGVIVRAAVATALFVSPLAMAMALMVVVAVIATGAVYFVDDALGVEPSVV